MKGISLFGQLLQHVPSRIFDRVVFRNEGEKHAKGFTCWMQTVAMLFCHLARADSLREICNGLASSLGKLRHLGVVKGPKRSSLSYANAHRPAKIYEELFFDTLGHFRAQGMLGASKKRFRFKNKLLSLDSTTISLCLSLFPWAKFRRAKGGIKVHVLLDHCDYMPSYVLITEARRHDRIAAEGLRLQAGSIVVMDRAYNDYDLFGQWHDEGVYFVTRMKDNADYTVREEQTVPQNRSIRADQIIELAGAQTQKKCPYFLRRVVVWDEENQREIVVLTNHLELGATTIADIYKDRWQIELFFKALKQTLKVKTFVGTSENALRIQIWTALLAMLLLKFLHYLSKAAWSLSNLAALLRINLLTYRDLRQWLDNPFDPPPDDGDGGEQLFLNLPGLGQPARS